MISNFTQAVVQNLWWWGVIKLKFIRLTCLVMLTTKQTKRVETTREVSHFLTSRVSDIIELLLLANESSLPSTNTQLDVQLGIPSRYPVTEERVPSHQEPPGGWTLAAVSGRGGGVWQRLKARANGGSEVMGAVWWWLIQGGDPFECLVSLVSMVLHHDWFAGLSSSIGMMVCW